MGLHTQRLTEPQAAGMPDAHLAVQSESGPKLVVAERSFSSLRGEEWDDFAVASGGSFLGSWRVINARRLLGRVKLFDFLLPDGTDVRRKVGQCGPTLRRTVRE